MRTFLPVWLLLLGLGAASGLLLFLSDYPVHLWPLQLVALVPLLFGLERWGRVAPPAAAVAATAPPAPALRQRPLATALLGLSVGVAYTVPLALVLEFPWQLAAGLVVYLILLWVVLACGVSRVLCWPAPWGPLAAGAVAVLVEWLNVSLLPIWGTAQSLVRVWSAAPWAAQLSSLAGMSGLVLVLFAGQALAVTLLTRPRQRRASLLALLLLLALAAGVNTLAWLRPAHTSLQVAAVGWTASQAEQARQSATQVLDRRLEPLLRQAARQGARLAVSPEVGLRLDAGSREQVHTRLAQLARELHLALAIGVFDLSQSDNRILFFDAQGQPRGQYRKTHLIPFVESYRAGRGELVLFQVDGVQVGGIICQDDNFTDLTRAYGRRQTQLLALPTQDWAQVKHYHLESSRFRAMENGFALVRAAQNGISAIIDPWGRLLAKRDHFRQGPGVIQARVPLLTGGALYSWAGDWLVGICLLALLAGGLADRRRRRAPALARQRRPVSDQGPAAGHT